ncbi:CCXG family PEP-CTERM protein [Flavihumibacter profundi]|uniref:CCXG family PEP-CTERM protein n=1 Tax=Flavihumibacter profundi TaxID=2716883 RepID=UPI001CC61E09|nr:CCXG family PEP-CTERM protein [Flavihumibacter profundi]MBZ5856348.1 CCXG family PEP-CTERM protein [Flavihumibacter profundi]
MFLVKKHPEELPSLEKSIFRIKTVNRLPNYFYLYKSQKLARLYFLLALQFTIFISFGQKGIINKDTSVCTNARLPLDAYPALSYHWFPKNGLNDTTSQHPILQAETTRTYYLESKYLSGNLIINSDFEKGNTGFISTYTFCNANNCLFPLAGNGYSVGTDASFHHLSFKGKDHTTGNGNFMIINGGNPSLIVWKQTIPVKPNTRYAFGSWISSLFNSNIAKIRFSINGIQVGTIYDAPVTLDKWEQFFTEWNSGTSTSAVIEIADVLPQVIGNDFGLDDIFFGEFTTDTSSVTVNVINKSLFTSDSIGLCNGPIVLNAGSGFDQYTWNTGATTSTISVLNTGTYSVLATQTNGCSAYDTIVVKNSLKMTTRPLIGCGDNLVLLNNGVIENVKGKVIEFFSDSAKTHQLNASVKMSTRASTHGRFNSAIEYKNYIDALVNLPPSSGYGDAYLPVYRIVSNNIVFNGSKSDIAYKYTIRFYAQVPGLYQFRTSFDFGNGGAIFLDGINVAFNNQDMWWAGNWNLPGQSLQWSTSLGIGMHEILVYGLEDCCDGGGSAEYKFPGGSEFTAFSTLAYVKDTGTYYVSLHDPVTGCNNNGSIKVTRNPKPVIQVQDPAPACFNTPVNLTAAYITAGSEPGLEFTYFKNKELTERVLNPAAILDSGTYYIVGQAPNSCISEAKEVRVKKFPNTAAQFSPSVQSGCTTKPITFRNLSSVNDSYRYHWTFGTGNAGDTSNQKDPQFSFLLPGKYAVKLIVFSAGGCFAEHTDTITILKNPGVSITGPTEICAGNQVQFNGTSDRNDNLTWLWNFGNGITSDLQKPAAQIFTTAGNYSIQLTGGAAACFDTAVFTLKVKAIPLIGLAGKEIRICKGKSVQLEANNGIKYLWSPQTGLDNPDIANPVANPATDTRYIVNVINENGCAATDSILLSVNKPFQITANEDEKICAGTEVQLNADGAIRYEWTPANSLNNAGIPNPIASPVASTAYRVIGFGPDNCFSDTANVNITVNELPAVFAGNDTTIIGGESLQLKINSSNDVTQYTWSPASFLSCTSCRQPISTPGAAIRYTVTVKNEAGCTATDDIAITLNCSVENVFIPNAFTPNNDGVNDRFYPLGRGIRSINYLRVFNRWGILVFERKNFSINDRSAGWDGRINGSLPPSQVFVYTLQLICDNGQLIDLKGNLSLIR